MRLRPPCRRRSNRTNITHDHCPALRGLGQAASRPLVPAAGQYNQTKNRQPNSLRIVLRARPGNTVRETSGRKETYGFLYSNDHAKDDSERRVWVAECDNYPRRVSVWTAGGKLLQCSKKTTDDLARAQRSQQKCHQPGCNKIALVPHVGRKVEIVLKVVADTRRRGAKSESPVVMGRFIKKTDESAGNAADGKVESSVTRFLLRYRIHLSFTSSRWSSRQAGDCCRGSLSRIAATGPRLKIRRV